MMTALHDLAEAPLAPCVTLYLDARVRERARTFVRRRVARALSLTDAPDLRADVERVREEASRRVDAGAGAFAIFACAPAGLFRVVELEGPIEDELAVGNGPALRQLAARSGEFERTLLVLVSPENARAYDIVVAAPAPTGTISGERVEAPRRAPRPRPARWIRLSYQRTVREHMDRHLREVAEKTGELAERLHPARIVVGGVHPTADRLMHELPQSLRTRVTPLVSLPAEGALADVAHSAFAQIREEETRRAEPSLAETIELVLAGGPAAVGLDEVMEAAREHRLMSLVMLAGFRQTGVRCRDCGGLARADEACAICGGKTEPVDLGQALVRAMIEQDGAVEIVPVSAPLERVGGMAARLRW